MNAQTAAALDRAYEVFGGYKDSYGFARHSGVTHSLRNLTREDWNVMGAKFDMEVILWESDWILLRHFLPRFLEWFSDDSDSSYWELWDLCSRLNKARWLGWPAAEVEALRSVFAAWMSELLPESDARILIDFLLKIEADLSRYLNVWLEARPFELAQWLWMVDWNRYQNVWRWATQPHVEAALETEFFRHPNGERAALLSRSIDLVRSLHG